MHCSREPSYHSAEHSTPNIAALSPMMHIWSLKCGPCTHTSPQRLRLIPSTLAASPVLFCPEIWMKWGTMELYGILSSYIRCQEATRESLQAGQGATRQPICSQGAARQLRSQLGVFIPLLKVQLRTTCTNCHSCTAYISLQWLSEWHCHGQTSWTLLVHSVICLIPPQCLLCTNRSLHVG